MYWRESIIHLSIILLGLVKQLAIHLRLRIDVHTHDIESGPSEAHARSACAAEQIEKPGLAAGTVRFPARIQRGCRNHQLLSPIQIE
jgi:hypothetical protein